jgi:hypothetical protein
VEFEGCGVCVTVLVLRGRGVDSPHIAVEIVVEGLERELLRGGP